jgi:hypothetical protein
MGTAADPDPARIPSPPFRPTRNTGPASPGLIATPTPPVFLVVACARSRPLTARAPSIAKETLTPDTSELVRALHFVGIKQCFTPLPHRAPPLPPPPPVGSAGRDSSGGILLAGFFWRDSSGPAPADVVGRGRGREGAVEAECGAGRGGAGRGGGRAAGGGAGSRDLGLSSTALLDSSRTGSGCSVGGGGRVS